MPARILIVDDEESIRYAFDKFLTQEGHRVTAVGNYDSALRQIADVAFDLIFVDIILEGGRSGLDILREINRRRQTGLVVVITARPDINTSTVAVRENAFDYLTKPIRKEKLLQVTRRALGHKALLEEKNRIEAEKENYRRNLDAIFRSLKDAIVTVDRDMRVIEANEAVTALCGLTPSEIIGRKFTDIPKCCFNSCKEILVETLDKKKSIRDYRIGCRHRDRPDQVVLLNSAPLTDHDNRFIGAVLVLRDITRLTSLERELRERHQFHNLIGKSPKMQAIYGLLEDLADTETSVLISGESGTGKELVARALHFGGIRADKSLVTVNCSALVEDLLESELFGHIKGAFTGAVNNKVGRFELANGGTLFLDEIGDISSRIQLKLLRVLQEREIERVGESVTRKVDVRVITATNRDLKARVREGAFREDLYYRLKVVEVALPPLRERREDVPLLADHFCKLFRRKFAKDIVGMSEDVLNLFMRYPWPGNVRELEHAIEHAFVLCHAQTIAVEHLPEEVLENTAVINNLHSAHSSDEPHQILQALKRSGWNKAKAARLLRISRQTIYRKIEEHQLSETDG